MDQIKTNKLVLDQEASGALNSMYASLKAEATPLKVTLSKIGSWIIKEYHSRLFEKEREKIIEAHFDKKRYLLDVLKSTEDGEDIFDAVKGALCKNEKPVTKTGQKKKTTDVAVKLTTDEQLKA